MRRLTQYEIFELLDRAIKVRDGYKDLEEAFNALKKMYLEAVFDVDGEGVLLKR